MAELVGSRALVTGASRGIGQAIAVKLATLGADVALAQRGDAAETIAVIRALGRGSTVVNVDLTDGEAAVRAVTQAADELGVSTSLSATPARSSDAQRSM